MKLSDESIYCPVPNHDSMFFFFLSDKTINQFFLPHLYTCQPSYCPIILSIAEARMIIFTVHSFPPGFPPENPNIAPANFLYCPNSNVIQEKVSKRNGFKNDFSFNASFQQHPKAVLTNYQLLYD